MQVIESTSTGEHSVDLPFDVLGMKITVGSGSFRICDVDYSLNAEQEHTVTVRPAAVGLVDGLLVREVATGDAVLFVDEREQGVARYTFPPGGPFELLESLFYCEVPAGCSDLDNADITLRKITPLEV